MSPSGQAPKKKPAARGSSKSGSRPPVPVSGPDLDNERRLGYPRVSLIGVDEVGRGCLAGPVVAGALLLPPTVDYERDAWLSEVSDSKCLTPACRERLAPLIESWAGAWGIGVATVEEIDRINIFHASHLAMARAIEATLQMAGKRDAWHVIVDGNRVPKGLPCPASAIVKGDLRCLSVAASSVLAKVWRDRHMAELDARFPGYAFGVHKGYSTPAHAAALKAQGPCELHRRSFAPIAELYRRLDGMASDGFEQLRLC